MPKTGTRQKIATTPAWIVDELDMTRSTTHRYVITLQAPGYLEQGASRKYRLGLRVTDLGMSALNATGLREHAHVYLEELCGRSSYTASLGVLDGAHVLYVDRVQSLRRDQRRLDLAIHPGSRLPAHAGFAIGDEELAADLYAIAAPVRSEAGDTVAVVSLAAHASLISLGCLVDSLGPHLIATAERILARLGYRRDDER